MKEIIHKIIHIIGFHEYKVQRQSITIYGAKYQNSH